MLDPRLRFFDLELLPFSLLPDTALLEIEVELDTGLSPADLITQAGIEFGQIVGQSLVRGERGRYVGGVEGEQLGTKFGEVDFLRVVAAVGFYQKARGFSSVEQGGVEDGEGGGGAVPSRRTMVRVKF